MATHELKIAPKWYEDVARWVKNFEIRNCDGIIEGLQMAAAKIANYVRGQAESEVEE